MAGGGGSGRALLQVASDAGCVFQMTLKTLGSCNNLYRKGLERPVAAVKPSGGVGRAAARRGRRAHRRGAGPGRDRRRAEVDPGDVAGRAGSGAVDVVDVTSMLQPTSRGDMLQ